MKDFLELVVRDASDGTSFRECQGARFNSHEIRYLKGEIIYVSSRGDVISFEEFEKLVYTAIVTKNRETCVRPFQLNVRSVRARELKSYTTFSKISSIPTLKYILEYYEHQQVRWWMRVVIVNRFKLEKF